MLFARVEWKDGLLVEDGTLRHRSRYGAAPTPSGLWELRDTATEKHDGAEIAFTLEAGKGLVIDLASGATKNVVGGELKLARVKAVELVLTTAPGPDVAVRLVRTGGVSAVEVRDRFALLDRARGWPVTGLENIANVGTVPVTGWIRIVGVKQ